MRLDKTLHTCFTVLTDAVWTWNDMNRRTVNPNITAQAQKPRKPMSPWKERLLVGTVVAVAGGGIIATSDLLIRNNQSTARIEQAVTDFTIRLDNFINIRYQSDMDNLDEEIANLNRRIDAIKDGD